MLPVIGTIRPWADPEVVSIGRLPMHVPLTRWDSLDDARNTLPSPWSASLDGRWRFRRFAHPDRVPASAVTGAGSSAGWGDTHVPGNWTLENRGDVPHYTNVTMPFPGPPPRLPDDVPTGVYRREFRVPRTWRKRQVVLHVGGAESVHAVYVNGAFVGYGTDSRLPSEYDITVHLVAGSNTVAIVVMRYSAQSYVEDQDQWWMAGLHRNVHLEARAAVHVADVETTAAWPDGSATLALDVRIATDSTADAVPDGWTVRAHLETLAGKRVAVAWEGRRNTASVPSEQRPYFFEGSVASLRGSVARVLPWSAEVPQRYRVLIELVAPDGTTREVVAQTIGFRSVEVRDRALLVNARRVMIRGVNRHDHHPERGKAVTVDDMRADLVAMKRHNINAVRCSHYPNDHRFLDLCDEIGLYVVDEANIESHAYNTSLCHDARYRSTWLARGARMVERDRNHPSVILWSLGNESGYGAHHEALAAWMRHSDPSRPLHYEGAVFHAGWVDGGRNVTDIVCPMYSPIWAVEMYGRNGLGDRPLIMCEYSHAMGNSNGSLADYWRVFENTPGLQGGFIWEWKDHGIRQTVRAAPGWRFAYGGQFGDTPNDANFVADGLMASDLVPHPVMRELAWVHRPVRVSLAPRGRGLVVENADCFRDVSWLAGTWTLRHNGVITSRGRLAVPTIAAGGSATIPLPAGVSAIGSGETHLSFAWRTKRDSDWAAAGHLVSWDEVALRVPGRAARPVRTVAGKPSNKPRVLDLVEVIEPTLWRAATDNDGFKLMSQHHGGGDALARWLHSGLPRGLPPSVQHRHTETEAPDGTVYVDHRFTLPEALADPARVGVRFSVPPEFTHVRWFGLGPHENYPDRRSGALTGIWGGVPDDLAYLVPQDFGLRTGCRWFELVAPSEGIALRITADAPQTVNCSATWHTDDDLFTARDQTELVRRDFLTVHVDASTRGLGTASCGPDVLPQYRIPAGAHRLRYWMSVRVLSQ